MNESALIERLMGLPRGTLAAEQARLGKIKAEASRPSAQDLVKAAADRAADRSRIEFLCGVSLGSALLDGSGGLKQAVAEAGGRPFSRPAQDLSGSQVQLLPARDFVPRDNRLGNGKAWKIDDASGPGIAARLSAIAASTPVVIDYDHQTLHTIDTGKRAPAAGWIVRAQWVRDEGLFATVRWTEAASEHIDREEYRFISPVIKYDADNRVVEVLMASLVNYPAIMGLRPVPKPQGTRQLSPESPPSAGSMVVRRTAQIAGRS